MSPSYVPEANEANLFLLVSGRTGLVLPAASLGALLSGPVQLGLLSPEFIVWARPARLFGVSLLFFSIANR